MTIRVFRDQVAILTPSRLVLCQLFRKDVYCKNCKLHNKKNKPIQIYFSNVKSALQNSLTSDARAPYFLDVLKECNSILGNIVISIGKKSSLRNQLAHETPIADLTESHFVINWLEDGTVLRFDHEVYGMPLVASTRKLVQTLSYLVMKSMAVFLVSSDSTIVQADLDFALAMRHGHFEPSWANPVISWRDFISTDSRHPEFTVAKTESDGFNVN